MASTDRDNEHPVSHDTDWANRKGAHRVDALRLALSRACGSSAVLCDRADCEPYRADDSGLAGPVPSAVVLARSAADIAKTLCVADAHDCPVTPRAGGTGRAGGATPTEGGIVLLTSGLSEVFELDKRNLSLRVSAGVITGSIHERVEGDGLFYPPDPGSLDSCTIGGNVGTNAGGPRALKYGTTKDYVLGMDAVLMGGQTLRVGRVTRKGVVGYDLTALLCGSEGTLAVVTGVTLRLLPRPPEVRTLLALYQSVRDAVCGVDTLLAQPNVPRCIEFMDELSLEAMRSEGAPLDTRARALLLVEIDGTAPSLDAELEEMGGKLAETSGVLDVLLAREGRERDTLWGARRRLSYATRKLAKHKLSEDVVVPRTRIADLLDEARTIGEARRLRHVAYGHAGDGNLHVGYFWDEDDTRPEVDAAIADLARAALRLGGSISGEHGIGLAKRHLLPLEHSPEALLLERGIKRTFDPRGLLNPGKIFPAAGGRVS